MGFGDVKLFGMFGAFCGLPPLLYLLLLACLIGTAVGLAGMLLAILTRNRTVPAAIAPLRLTPDEVAALIAAYPLGESEKAVVNAALEQPGSVGPVRHHLPFGPSLAVAAFFVFLHHVEIEQWFQHIVARMSGLPS
jgi:prepilin signal peptidase PulO-like enzyme (type II secretory pathway)